MKSNTIKNLKQELKDLAIAIRLGKTDFKIAQRHKSQLAKDFGVDALDWYDRWKKTQHLEEWHKACNDEYKKLEYKYKLQREFRHKHIAYCLLRGRTLEQIESQNINPSNKRDIELVKTLVAKYQAMISKEVVDAQASGTTQV